MIADVSLSRFPSVWDVLAGVATLETLQMVPLKATVSDSRLVGHAATKMQMHLHSMDDNALYHSCFTIQNRLWLNSCCTR